MKRKRTNAEWLAALRSPDEKNSAIEDLRSIVLAGLPYALSPYLSQSDPRFNALAEEVAQETVMRVLKKMDTFQGRSQFTTWVHTIGVRIALTELRRARWKDYSLDEMLAGNDASDRPRNLPDKMVDTEAAIEQDEMMRMVGQAMKDALTEKQRTALVAVALHELPMEEVARRMDTNRNALYKLLHDARLKLKKQMEAQGYFTDEILSSLK